MLVGSFLLHTPMTAPTRLLLLFLLGCPLVTLQAGVVINEIFYNAPGDFDRLEYVELHNTDAESVGIGNWTFGNGIEYTFPEDAVIEGGGYLVLCADKALFEKFYRTEPDGVFEKSLDNGGETLTLEDGAGKVVETVKYDDRAPWPVSPDGYSASLERLCPTAPPNQASNWAASVLSDDYDSKPSGTPGAQNSVHVATLPPVISEVTFSPEIVSPGERVVVRAKVEEGSVVELCYRVVAPGNEGEEITLEMKKKGETFEGTIPGQEEANRIIRFRVKASRTGSAAPRFYPAPNEIRPAISVYVRGEADVGAIPLAHFFGVDARESRRLASYRRSHAPPQGRGGRFGGFGEMREEDRLRMELGSRLSGGELERAWTELTLNQGAEPGGLALGFRRANRDLSELREALDRAADEDLASFSEALSEKLTTIQKGLAADSASFLTESQKTWLETTAIAPEPRRGRGGRRFRVPSGMMQQFLNVENSWFRSACLDGLDETQLGQLKEAHAAAMESRAQLAEMMRQGRRPDFQAMMERASEFGETLDEAVQGILSEPQLDAFERDRPPSFAGFGRMGGGRSSSAKLKPQGGSAFVYTDPQSGETQLFDFVNIRPRKSGHKVRFHKDRPLNGMTTINLLYQGDESTILNKALAYEVYRKIGNATPEAGFMRVLIGGEVAGYHVWFEQPNGNFFRRHEIDDGGNLYKLIWMGSHRPSEHTPPDKQPERLDIVGRHEKKTHPHDGYEDIVSLVEALEQTRDDDAMWRLIEKHFDVDQVINYFAANSLISHWDGFFNNYFTYHDVEDTKKWTMYPWDQDSTWSQRGGSRDLYAMPLNFGAEGARPDGSTVAREERDRRGDGGGRRGRGGFRGFGGGPGAPGWWRDGGDFSRPLLANPEFRKRYRARLKVLLDTVFTEEVFGSEIDAIEASIGPEVRLRAESFGRDPEVAERAFQSTVDSLREHLTERRAFLLGEL